MPVKRDQWSLLGLLGNQGLLALDLSLLLLLHLDFCLCWRIRSLFRNRLCNGWPPWNCVSGLDFCRWNHRSWARGWSWCHRCHLRDLLRLASSCSLVLWRSGFRQINESFCLWHTGYCLCWCLQATFRSGSRLHLRRLLRFRWPSRRRSRPTTSSPWRWWNGPNLCCEAHLTGGLLLLFLPVPTQTPGPWPNSTFWRIGWWS